MKKLFVFLILAAGFSAHATEPLSTNPNWVEKHESCNVKNPVKMVYYFKQWHLDPSADTKNASKPLPQAENQIAIYAQIKKWIDDKKLSSVLAEGCSGEITKDFSKKFNGWTMADLINKKADPSFEKILTHVPMKLEAFYGSKIHTTCADDENEIHKQLMEMSDIRGDMGFMTRIDGFKNKPEDQKKFLDGAREALKLSQDQGAAQVTAALKKDIDAKLKNIQEGLSKRNQAVLAAVKNNSDKEMALVFGGLHAKELKGMFEKENIGCEIIEPKGYKEE